MHHRQQTVSMSMIAVFLCLVAVLAVAIAADPLAVTTTEGTVHGASVSGVRAWFNIPFAKPPVNKRRFRAPKPATAYEGGNLDASTFAPIACRSFVNPETTEDCLYLDVYAPPEDDPVNYPNGYPVMFWIHGGALVTGSKSEAYEGLTYACT